MKRSPSRRDFAKGRLREAGAFPDEPANPEQMAELREVSAMPTQDWAKIIVMIGYKDESGKKGKQEFETAVRSLSLIEMEVLGIYLQDRRKIPIGPEEIAERINETYKLQQPITGADVGVLFGNIKQKFVDSLGQEQFDKFNKNRFIPRLVKFFASIKK